MGILFIILIVILATMSPYILTAINICCIFNPKKPICGISWGLTFIMGPVVGAYYFEKSEGQNDLWASQMTNSGMYQIINEQNWEIFLGLVLIGFIGFWVLAACDMERMPLMIPLLVIVVMCPAAVTCVIWCGQVCVLKDGFMLMFLPINMIIMMCSLIQQKIREWREVQEVNSREA